MLFRQRQRATTDKYVVKDSFVLREWGDAYGTTECSRTLPIGTQITIQPHKNGDIKRIWVDGVEWGKHSLITKKSEIVAHCLRTG